jgi:hypothetical protein
MVLIVYEYDTKDLTLAEFSTSPDRTHYDPPIALGPTYRPRSQSANPEHPKIHPEYAKTISGSR